MDCFKIISYCLIILSYFGVNIEGYVLRGIPAQIEQSFVDYSQYDSFKELSRSGTYAFGYDIQDMISNNVQFKNEMRHPNGTVTGSYGYLEPDGNIHITHYVADHNGYRAIIEDSDREKKLKAFPPLENGKENQLLFSPEMLNAIEAREVFRKQSLHENRLRPIDRTNNIQTLQDNRPVGHYPVLYPTYY